MSKKLFLSLTLGTLYKKRHGLQNSGRMKLPHTILKGVCKPCLLLSIFLFAHLIVPYRWQLCPHAGLREAAPCSGNSVGQQEIHEHEALRGGFGRRLYCRLTSFSRSLQINLRIILDSTTKNMQHCFQRCMLELRFSKTSQKANTKWFSHYLVVNGLY